MKKKQNRDFKNVWIAGIGSFFTDISSEMIYPLIPIFLTVQLGVGASVVGLIEGVAESTASVLKVFSGYLSDLVGKRKKLAISGYSLSAVGKLLLYVSVVWPMVLLSRFVDRFGKGIRTAPRDALISESVSKKERGKAFGLHRAMDTLGAAAGVLISIVILTYAGKNYPIRNIFLFSLIPAVMGIGFLLFLRETGKGKPEEKPGLSWSVLNVRLKLFLLVTLVFTLGNSSDQFLILKAKNLGASITGILAMYFVYNIVYGLTSYPAGKLSDIFSRKRLIVPGYFFYGLVYILAARSNIPGGFYLIFALYGLYMGLTYGVEKALISDISPPDIKASALGLQATIVGLGLFPASLIAGFLWDYIGISAPFYFGAVMSFLAAIAMWIVLSIPVKQ